MFGGDQFAGALRGTGIAPGTGTGLAAAAAATTSPRHPTVLLAVAPPNHDDDVEDKDDNKLDKGKSLPRVKNLLTREFEGLLSGTIMLLHDCNCASYRSAASENPWARAFKEFHDSVASEYSRPSGKNRIHKFKAKMVELWKAMEMELESGDKSRSDPIYSMALRQYRRYNSVLSNPELESNRPFPSTDPSNSRTANTEPPPPQPELTEMDRMRKSLLRLERMMTQNGWAQPKLPSPLNELQHLKEQMTQQQFDTSVRPTYEREIGKYLTGVHTQARFSNSPAYLPGVLDGIDVLRYTPQPSSVAWTLKSTYDYVLNKYMELLNGTDTSEARKRKRGDGSVEDIAINSEERATEDAGGETKQSDYV